MPCLGDIHYNVCGLVCAGNGLHLQANIPQTAGDIRRQAFNVKITKQIAAAIIVSGTLSERGVHLLGVTKEVVGGLDVPKDATLLSTCAIVGSAGM